MGSVDAIATLGAILLLLVIFAPFVPGASELLPSIPGLLTLAILVLLLLKTWEISDELKGLRRELNGLGEGME